MCCAYAQDPLEKAKASRAAAKARQAALTPEEKEQKKLEAVERAALRKLKKDWEQSLTVWTGGDPHRGKSFPNGTKVCCSSPLRDASLMTMVSFSCVGVV